jgi:UPF0716 protein FxsA
MLLKLILLLTVTPLVELYLLMRLAQLTGVAATILIVLSTGVLGGILARAEVVRVLARIQEDLRAQRMPGNSLIEGAMILVAGALLVTPGIITDAVGFLILLPPTRVLLRDVLKYWLKKKIDEGKVDVYKRAGFGPIRDDPPPGSPPLENEDENE